MVLKSLTKVFKSGNSNAVRLNKNIMDAAGLKANDPVNVTFNAQDGSVTIKAVKKANYHDNFSKLLEKRLHDDRETLDFLKDK